MCCKGLCVGRVSDCRQVIGAYTVVLSMQASDGPMPTCFRYEILPVASFSCNVFKPAALGEEAGSLKHQTIGALFQGNMDKVISNKRASVVWEAVPFLPLVDLFRSEFIVSSQ